MQLVLSLLLLRQHAARKDWGLNWLSFVMFGGGLINLIAPSIPPSVASSASPRPADIALLLGMGVVGFSDLGALLVGIQAYAGKRAVRPLRVFGLASVGSFVVTMVAARLGITLAGDVVAMGFMLWCAHLSRQVARDEQTVGHHLVTICLLVQPAALLTLLSLRLEPTNARYIASLPFTLIGVALIYVTSTRFEHSARRGEMRFRDLFDQSPVPLLLLDHQRVVAAVNKAWVAKLGYDLSDLSDLEAWWEQAYPDPSYRAQIRSYWASGVASLAEGSPGIEPLPARIRCRDGHTIHVLFGGTRVDAGLIVSITDVTDFHEASARLQELNEQLEQRVAERTRQLEESSQRLSYVLDATGEGVWDWNIATGTLYNNARWCRILGRPEDDGMHQLQEFERHLPEDVRPAVFGKLQACLEEGVPYRSEHEMLRYDGSRFWVVDRGDVVERDSAGRPLRMVGSFADISVRKAAELAAHDAQLRLAERNRELSDALDQLRRTQDELVHAEKLASLGALVAGIAHELNTPIGNALVMVTTVDGMGRSFRQDYEGGLKRSTLEKFMGDVQEASQIIERNLRRASELINSFKQIAVDQSSDQRRQFLLHDLLNEVIITLRPTLRKANIGVALGSDVAVRMDSFPGQLSQVIINLIDNCVVHAFADAADPQIRIEASATPGGHAAITVADNGSGISGDIIERIFDPFFTTRLGTGGSGLGLHLVYNIVTGVLGGTVRVQSQVGVGTTFRIEIPCRTPETPAASPRSRLR